MRRGDLWWRALAVIASVAATLAGAPAGVRTPLFLLATGAVAERVARLRDRGTVDALLTATGGSVVAFILAGLLLDLTGIGLRPATWAVALGVLAFGGLLLASRRPAPSRARARRDGKLTLALLTVPWVEAALAVTVVAVAISVHATDRGSAAPTQMAFGKIDRTSVQVVVRSDHSVGPLELRTTSASGATLSYPLFSVSAGRPVTTAVIVPRTGRYSITLNYPNQSAPLRTLTLDR